MLKRWWSTIWARLAGGGETGTATWHDRRTAPWWVSQAWQDELPAARCAVRAAARERRGWRDWTVVDEPERWS